AKSLTTLLEVAMTEAQQLKLATKRSMQQTHISQASGFDVDEGTGTIPGVLDVPTKESDEEISWKSNDEEGDDDDEGDDGDDDEEGNDNDEDEGDDDEDDQEEGSDDEQASDEEGVEFIHPSLSTHDEEETRDEEIFDHIPKTPENTDDEGNGIKSIFQTSSQMDVQPQTTVAPLPFLSTHDEEETRDEESFDPIPKTPENTDDEGNGEQNLGINVGREEGQDEEDEEDELYKDVNINLGRGVQIADVHTTQEFEDSHVTLTLVNPDGQQQSLSVSSQFVTSMLNPTADAGIESIFETTSQTDVQTPTSVATLPVSTPTLTPLTISTITTVQQAPTPLTTAPSTLLQDRPNFGLLFGFDHRLKTLEANFSEFMQTNQFAGASDRLRNEAQAENEEFLKTIDENMQKIIKEQVKEQVKIILDTYGDTVTLKRHRDDDADKDEEPSTGSDRGKRRKGARTTHEMEEPSHPEFETGADDQPIAESSQHPEWFSLQKKPPTPDRQQYLHNLLKPLPLISNSQGRRVIPFDHFINNDLEYLRGGTSSRKYTTSVTKTKAADYGHIKWIKDLFYGFAVNRESAHDVYSKRRIIARLQEAPHSRHMRYVTASGLRKLTNLTVEEHFAFNVSLRMFTRSIVIQRRVEDLQLGVKSYQKKLNLTRPDTYCSDLKRKEAYIAYSNPRGFIYQNKDKHNRLMRIDELHKFNDGTLTDVRTTLDDRKEPELASALKEKATRSASKSTQGSKSRQTSASKSTTAEEPMQTTHEMEEPSHPEFKTGADDQPIAEPSQHLEWFSQQKKPPTLDRDWNKAFLATHKSIQLWISELAKQTDTRSFFNELMGTPIDFSAFLMIRLKVDTLTSELLAGPTYELMKGSCKSLVELEFFLEEPLPLIPNSRGRRVIPFDYFINNDLEYLRGGASSHKYTTSVTKTKATDYGHIKWIEDLVPSTMWIQEPVGHDKHALWGISYWGRKHQQFYGFAVNRESARDVYSKLIIITEGDFKRLRIQDIEDMLLLLVQGKLINLTVEECFSFNVSLRMFTRSIVIQRRVEDLQLGVESYQKKLKLTRPDTYRFDLKRKEAYITYSNPRGFIYQNKDKQNRLMRIDELHKFSDGTLTDVRTSLDDRLKGIRMKYLPQTSWRKSDKERVAAMIQAIDKQLKTRRIIRSLERFVGGRLYEGDFRMLQRTI
nr:hypothetical protein [Tanacetum cinerariifolium]